MTLEELHAELAALHDTFQLTDAFVRGTKITTHLLTGLAAVVQTEADAVLTLKQAADISGYSVDHLGRMVLQGRIPNAGRPRAPRIRRGDLPSRPQFAKNRSGSYDVNADVQSILSRRGDR